MTEFLVEGNVIKMQANNKKKGQIVAIIQQQDRQEKLPIELQVEDRQEQVLIGPAPIRQEDCGVIGKIQNNHQENQKGLNSGMSGIDPAGDNLETFEPPVIPQAPPRSAKNSFACFESWDADFNCDIALKVHAGHLTSILVPVTLPYIASLC